MRSTDTQCGLMPVAAQACPRATHAPAITPRWQKRKLRHKGHSHEGWKQELNLEDAPSRGSWVPRGGAHWWHQRP